MAADDPGLNPEMLAPEALARAEAALAALHGDYLTWAANDLDRLRCAVAALRRTAAGGRAEAARVVFAIAHDIKGQAATFDYPLLSRLGMALCRLAEAGEGACATRAEALTAAMGLVLQDRLTGDGGDRGRLLVARLEGLGIAVPVLSV